MKLHMENGGLDPYPLYVLRIESRREQEYAKKLRHQVFEKYCISLWAQPCPKKVKKIQKKLKYFHMPMFMHMNMHICQRHCKRMLSCMRKESQVRNPDSLEAPQCTQPACTLHIMHLLSEISHGKWRFRPIPAICFARRISQRTRIREKIETSGF